MYPLTGQACATKFDFATRAVQNDSSVNDAGPFSNFQFFWRYRVHPFGDAAAALQFLGRFKTDAAAMARLRGVIAQRSFGGDFSRVSDDQVLAQVAALLGSGELVAGYQHHEPIQLPEAAAEEAPAPAFTPKPQRTRERQEPDPPTFSAQHDGAGQADALAMAAASGVPFCEECARAANEGTQ